MKKIRRPLGDMSGFAAHEWSIMKRLKLAKHSRRMGAWDLVRPDRSKTQIDTPLTGGTMKITFDRSEHGKTNPNANGKTFPVIRVFGTALDGKNPGQEWSTQFFASNRALADQVKNLSKGDTVNVKMVKNGSGYWNPDSFEKDTTSTAGTSPSESTSSGCTGTGCNGTPDQVKLECFKTAVKAMGPKPAKTDVVEWIMQAAAGADLIKDYLDGKGPFQFENTGGIPDEDEATDE